MKCFRVKLSDRRDATASAAARRGSPRHYCQRRLANSFLDEQEWLKRYSPERYHLESYGHDDDVDAVSRPPTPSTGRESEIFKISTTKNVFCPAFLTINNLDFPSDASGVEFKSWSKKRARYKMVPKNCSANLHRMFVKSELVVEEMSRTSSRASTDYDEYEYEDYLKQYCDDSLECSLYDATEDDDEDDRASNNNDSDFANKNEYLSTESSKICETSEHSNLMRIKELNADVSRASTSNHKREKRKSLTLSRIPSPETVQVIRIDVITGYPVSSDNSVLSEVTDNDKTISEGDSNISFIKPVVYQKEVHLHSLGTQTENIDDGPNDYNNISTRYYIESERLLNCKSVCLTDRLSNAINK